MLISAFTHYYFSSNVSVTGTRPEKDRCEFHFIDVGQGDAILIRTYDTEILIDTGPNVSEYKLKSYLDSLNIKTFDACFFTHPDEDHIGNADMILSDFFVSSMIIPPLFSDNLSYSLMMNEAKNKGITPVYAITGSEFNYGDLIISVLSPISKDVKDINEGSLVLRVVFGKTVVLLMSDVGTDTENFIISVTPADKLCCDILKVGHHGSQSSTGNSLLSVAKPEFAVISCAKNNSFGHPHSAVLSGLYSVGAEVFRTDRLGTIVFVSDMNTVNIK